MASVEYGEKKRWAKYLMPVVGDLELLLCSFAWIWVNFDGIPLLVRNNPTRTPTPLEIYGLLLTWLTVNLLAVAVITAVFFRSMRWGFLIVPRTFISGMLLTVALTGATITPLNEDDNGFGAFLAVIGGIVLAVAGTAIGRYIGKLWKVRQ